MIFDTAIIGAGPAGLSAAINLQQRGKQILWIASAPRSSKTESAARIVNYPGLGILTGQALNDAFHAHAAALQLSVTEAKVTAISRRKQGFTLLADNELYQAKTLLLAIGAVAAKGYPGESELLGNGVSYCATCDGALFKGKTIAVCCFDRRYAPEVRDLAAFAAQVYLYTSYDDPDPVPPNVTRLTCPPEKIEGEERVCGIRLSDGQSIPLDGVFLLRNAVAPALLLPKLELDGPHIAVNRAMETNLPGCFACGDCTGRPYQIAKAVGEGNIAAHSILAYLDATD